MASLLRVRDMRENVEKGWDGDVHGTPTDWVDDDERETGEGVAQEMDGFGGLVGGSSWSIEWTGEQADHEYTMSDNDARRSAAQQCLVTFARDALSQWREGGPLLPLSMMPKSLSEAKKEERRKSGGWGVKNADVKLLRYLTIMAESTLTHLLPFIFLYS